jgi:hypothetical protein
MARPATPLPRTQNVGGVAKIAGVRRRECVCVWPLVASSARGDRRKSARWLAWSTKRERVPADVHRASRWRWGGACARLRFFFGVWGVEGAAERKACVSERPKHKRPTPLHAERGGLTRGAVVRYDADMVFPMSTVCPAWRACREVGRGEKGEMRWAGGRRGRCGGSNWEYFVDARHTQLTKVLMRLTYSRTVLTRAAATRRLSLYSRVKFVVG